MIVLGIDPGLHVSGYGVLRTEHTTIYLVDYGHLTMPQTKTIAEKTCIFHDFFEQKIHQFSVGHVALETPFLGKNAQGYLKLGYLRGLLYLLSSKNACELHEFAPRQVKQAVTGYGGASKEQVCCIVRKLFAGAIKADKFDVTDALAVTLCAVWLKQ